jgi:hypothetical protein
VSIPAPGGSLVGGGVTLIRAGETTGTEIPLAAFEPGAAAQDIGTAEHDAADATCYLPAGTAVALGDRIVCYGVTYQVSGAPQTWQSPWTGMQGPVRVYLRR